MKKVLPLIVLVAVVLTLWGGAYFAIVLSLGGIARAEGNFRYIVKDGEAIIVEYKDLGDVNSVTIPPTLGGYPVTTVNNFGFVNTTIVREIHIGKGLVNISSWSFTNNVNLERFVVDVENPNYKSVDGVLFNKDMSVLLFYPNSGAAEYTVPEGVKRINDQAFYKCGRLTKITFNSDLLEIGQQAFLLSVRLESVVFPEGLKLIETHAFLGCSGDGARAFNTIVIPSSVEYIGNFAFYNCVDVTSVTVNKPESETSGWGTKWYPTQNGDRLSVGGNLLEIQYL